MQHQYWVTKKSVLRKLGGKEDECIISSDAELDAKLELFKSINESCVQLQRVIDLYQERLCYLAQEENALGRYLKECGKNEKNANAGQILTIAGKALSYSGHQRLTVRTPLVRLHHEVDTFRGRAVTDTRATVTEMEKCRTEYRAALSWMKSASSQLDPDTGHGLEKFRKTQTYVKTTKTKFDKYTLACLQKVDLLAAARCNMFSHALVPYQNAIASFSKNVANTLSLTLTKLQKVEPYDFSVVTELAIPAEDKDKSTFFNSEYSDKGDKIKNKESSKEDAKNSKIESHSDPEVSNLIGEEFLQQEEEIKPTEGSASSAALLDLTWPANADLMSGNFMPSQLIQEGSFTFTALELDKLDSADTNNTVKNSDKPKKIAKSGDKAEKTDKQVAWLSLFADLDPLASQNNLANKNPDQL